jgi:hypothetical protein
MRPLSVAGRAVRLVLAIEKRENNECDEVVLCVFVCLFQKILRPEHSLR